MFVLGFKKCDAVFFFTRVFCLKAFLCYTDIQHTCREYGHRVRICRSARTCVSYNDTTSCHMERSMCSLFKGLPDLPYQDMREKKKKKSHLVSTRSQNVLLAESDEHQHMKYYRALFHKSTKKLESRVC